MADAEGSHPDHVTPAAAPAPEAAPVPQSDDSQKLNSVAPGNAISQQPLTIAVSKKKPHMDFWYCTGLLVIFALVCGIGFVILRFTTFADTADKYQLLSTRRDTAYHGVVNLVRKVAAPAPPAAPTTAAPPSKGP